MSLDDIDHVRTSLVECARRAAQAGFDGVEVHAANGYLLDQFITRYGNQRTDQYGGSPENRARFTAEVIAAIRGAMGDDFVVGVRMSQAKVNDFDYRWQGVDEASRLLGTVAGSGAHYVHVASEGVSWENSAFLEEGVSVTGLAREVCKVPVIANGALGEPGEAARLVREGHADLISLGESALANADWPNVVALGKPLNSFDIEMLKPEVTIENALAWRRSKG
jgi:2,4-dienoyl-CoA reductase-like NADH-dependent reductase (Old Yellow Enzyme family)